MLCLKIAGGVANSVDPDETLQSRHCTLQCLIWVYTVYRYSGLSDQIYTLKYKWGASNEYTQHNYTFMVIFFFYYFYKNLSYLELSSSLETPTAINFFFYFSWGFMAQWTNLGQVKLVILPNYTFPGQALSSKQSTNTCAQCFTGNWQPPFLNQGKGENEYRKYFMINLHKIM